MPTQDNEHQARQAAVRAAMQMWLTLEYLSPQKPPAKALEENNCTWLLSTDSDGDADMPWRDPDKLAKLDKLFRQRKRFLLFAGIIPGGELVETVRGMLHAPDLDFAEQREPEQAAAVVIPIDENGFVAGSVFISSVPWALGKMLSAVRRGSLFNFTGFFGQDGAQAEIIKDLDILMRERQLVVDDTGTKAEETNPKRHATAPGQARGHGFGEVRNWHGTKRAQADGSPGLDEEPREGSNGAQHRLRRRTLTVEDVRLVVELVFKRCGWAPQVQANWVIQTQPAPEKASGRRAEDPLNSFYAEDLEHVQDQYVRGRYGKAVGQYLEMRQHHSRVDVETVRDHLIAGVHPLKTPLAAWPGKYPLVTAQQFAVNTLCQDLADGGLFSVNGPPGTGKTTMLKDILAAVVQQRADALMAFDEPVSAFKERLEIERHPYPAHKIDVCLAGFGIVVTSANNGAVENISKELPGIAAIASEVDIDYFADVADSIGLGVATKRPAQRERWGLVSAVLGSQSNKTAFASDFWFGKKPFAKKLPPGQTPPAPDPQRRMGLQDWVNSRRSTVPSWPEAKARYRAARETVEAAMAKAACLATKLEQLHAINSERPKLLKQVQLWEAENTRTVGLRNASQQRRRDAEAALATAKAEYDAAAQAANAQTEHQAAKARLKAHQLTRPHQETLDVLNSEIAITKKNLESIRQDLQAHNTARPGFLAGLFKSGAMQRWQKRSDVLTELVDARRSAFETKTSMQENLRQWNGRIGELEAEVMRTRGTLEAAEHKLTAILPKSRTSLKDLLAAKEAAIRERDLANQAHDDHERAAAEARANMKTWNEALARNSAACIKAERDLEAAGLAKLGCDPWRLREVSRDRFHSVSPYHDDDKVLFAARRELFKATMELHQAFIVAAWPKLRGTLSAFVDMLMGKIQPSEVKGGPMQLWDAFFLVVPLVSTTFASLPRLFRGVGQEDLAWLLIDEAGQAAPQLAAGAIWRAKRAVVVGDPIQLEPVVSVPKELVDPVREHCGADKRYLAPEASAQILADTANQYGTHLDRPDKGKIWLGSPLVVHRRCLSPMFDVCNHIAYAGRMVYGAGKDNTAENVPLSQWIDLPAVGAAGHWVPSQGKYALDLVRDLAEGGLWDAERKLRIYVVTPFKAVAQNMRRLIANAYDWKLASQMCGTVHTFQGKEADFVLFLLGGNPASPGVISRFAGASPNLVNVAVSRGKKRLYVIGDRAYWTGATDVHRIYTSMAEALDAHQEDTVAEPLDH
ncbi:hypothetical protein CBP36_21160 (plasmid) [Acidovorax carolinensis]|uniref:DNA2/NAM7 helicase-like C-terminal domain-containing protein n=1 Tax=Acidovorax carolinensis TaxID=553814 RepID=A0A240UKC8_9BURK|nr:ATP-binding protein [Acidovorax carolinensis]ART61479.1 hypothetical protein CBP36_21160 [Acidovorax carolinensis]